MSVLLTLLPNCTLVLVSLCNSAPSYPVLSIPFLPDEISRLPSPSFGQDLPGSGKASEIRFLNTLSDRPGPLWLSSPQLHHSPRARVSFYNRQADHGIRSSNYATVIAEQGNRFSTPVQERYTMYTRSCHTWYSRFNLSTKREVVKVPVCRLPAFPLLGNVTIR